MSRVAPVSVQDPPNHGPAIWATSVPHPSRGLDNTAASSSSYVYHHSLYNRASTSLQTVDEGSRKTKICVAVVVVCCLVIGVVCVSLYAAGVFDEEQTTKEPTDYTCGNVMSLPRSRIVGGEDAERGQYPWMVLLRHNGKSFCGGSIIDSLHILTAAHCVDHYYRDRYGVVYNPSRLDVVAGRHETSGGQDDPPEQEASAAGIVLHRNYDDDTFFHDIALIRLESPLTFNSRVAPICLPTVSSQLPSPCIVAGWGTTKYDEVLTPDVLQAVTLQTYDYTQCSHTFSSSFYSQHKEDIDSHLHPGVMCAANALSGGKDTCQGDSGGPLFCLEDDDSGGRHYTQYGVTSSGFGCGTPGSPGFYTYLPYYLDWLEDTAKPSLE